MPDEARRTFSLTIHPWCMSPSRDEAVRAAEDNRQGPLPTLEEAIETITHKGDDMATNGLRTERVVLEITHNNFPHASVLDWPYMVANYFHRTGESVRVVEDGDSWRAACESARIASGTIADITAERDAAIRERNEWHKSCHYAIRERDKLRGEITSVLDRSEFASKELTRLRARVADLESQLESVADRAAAAETALEAAPAASVVPDVVSEMADILRSNATDDEKHSAIATLVEAVCPGWRLAPAASGVRSEHALREIIAATVHDAMRFERESETPEWQAGNSFAESRARQAATDIADLIQQAPAASGAAKSYWMVRWPEGGDHDIDDELFVDEQTARHMAELEDGAVVVELVERHSASGAAGTGWLMADERELIASLADSWNRRAAELERPGTWGSGLPSPKSLRSEAAMLRALLARSLPPEVVRPGPWEIGPVLFSLGVNWKQFIDDLFEKRDAEWIAALAAAGVKVKEVGK